MNKRGGVNWTVGKLINIILLLVVLGLVFYGVAHEGFGPLLENIKLKFNETKIMIASIFGVDRTYSGGCYSSDAVDLIGGSEFLNELGLNGKDVVLESCGNVCTLKVGGVSAYRVDGGNFQKDFGGRWVGYFYRLDGDLDRIKMNHEVYEEGYRSIGVEEMKLIKGWEDRRLNAIYDHYGLSESRRQHDRDNVDKCTDCQHGEPCNVGMCNMVGLKLGVGCEYDPTYLPFTRWKLWGGCKELSVLPNSPKYLEDLRELFIKEFLEAAKDAVDIDGVNYVIDIEIVDRIPVVVFTSANNKFGLKYDEKSTLKNWDYVHGEIPNKKIESKKYPFFLIAWSGSGWLSELAEPKENHYRLPDSYFKRAYRERVVERFIRDNCR